VQETYFSRSTFIASFFAGPSRLIVTSRNGRRRYIRFTVTSSGSSATHGPHHITQTLTTSSCLVSVFASFATPSSSSASSVTASRSHFSRDRRASSRLSAHFVEQPKTRVFATGTGLPASSASMAVACVRPSSR
jgi:hypothetical protein